MTHTIIAIKGDFINDFASIAECFNYVYLQQDEVFYNAEKFNDYIQNKYFEIANNDMVVLGTYVSNSFTIINDPESVNTVDEEALLKLSAKLNAEVFTFIIQTTSASFGFAKYETTKLRNFFYSDGEELENFGTPLKEENGLHFNQSVFIDDILNVAANLGIDLEGNNANSFVVKHFTCNDEMKQKLAPFKQPIHLSKKPWWKIW